MRSIAARALATVGRGIARAGHSLRSAFPTGNSALLPSPVLSGVTVTPETALNFIACYAAINVLSTDVSSFRINLTRRKPDGSKAPEAADRRHDLMYCSPDGEISSGRWRRALMGHALSWGNGYAEIKRDNEGIATRLILLDPRPSHTKVERRNGVLGYSIEKGKRWVLAENVIHLAGLGWDGITGYSPIGLARQGIGLGLAAEEFGAAFFGNGSQAKGYLKTKGRLHKETLARLREDWNAVHQGTRNAHKIAILEEGMEFQGTSIAPEDAQFLATRTFQVIEMARLFRLPPHKIGDYSQAHLANLEESNLDYLTTSLTPWCVAIEDELNLKLLTSADRLAGLSFEHDFSSLLRANTAARGAFYQQMFTLGVFSPNDICAREGLNPIPVEEGGNKRFVQLNLVTLDQAGQWVKVPAASGAPADAGDDQAGAEGEARGVSLDGGQVASLLSIANMIAARAIPLDAGKGLIAASFPALGSGQIDAILAPLAHFQNAPPPLAA